MKRRLKYSLSVTDRIKYKSSIYPMYINESKFGN